MNIVLKELALLKTLRADADSAQKNVDAQREGIAEMFCPFFYGDKITCRSRNWTDTPKHGIPWANTHDGKDMVVRHVYLSNVMGGFEDTDKNYIDFRMTGSILKQDGTVGLQDGETHVRIFINKECAEYETEKGS